MLRKICLICVSIGILGWSYDFAISQNFFEMVKSLMGLWMTCLMLWVVYNVE